MSITIISKPAIEPVTLDEAKAHLKVDTTGDDALIGGLISTARTRVEWHIKRALITQSWTHWRDDWPACGVLEIPLPPLQAVTSITTYAMNDAASVLDAGTYQVDTASMPGRAALKAGVAPPLDLRALNCAAVAFRAGYGDTGSDVPADLRQAILQIVACHYANRGDISVEPPAEAFALMQAYRVISI